MTEFNFYTDVYFGDKIPVSSWEKFSNKAKIEVDFLTYGRTSKVDPLPKEVNFCICEIAELLYDEEQNDNGNVQSESTDGHSVTYAAKKNKSELQTELRNIALKHLSNTGLMYPGFSNVRL